MNYPTELNRTPDGDFVLPEMTVDMLNKVQEQLSRLVQVLDADTMTVSSLLALVTILHNKVDKLHAAAECFIEAAVIQMERDDDTPFTTADMLDDRFRDLLRMYDEYAYGVEVPDAE